MPTVNPEILRWARETAGLDMDRAADALGIRDSKKRSASDRLTALEVGAESPSRGLLVKMAQKYRRPLLTFYLDAPPKRGERGEDFRSVPDRQTDSESSVDALVRDIRARQAMVRDIVLDDERPVRLPFIGSMQMADGAAEVLASIRRHVQLDLGDYRAQSSSESAFALLRNRLGSPRGSRLDRYDARIAKSRSSDRTWGQKVST